MKTAYLDTIEDAPGPFVFAVDEAGRLLALKFLDGNYDLTIEQELARVGYQMAHDARRTAQARTQLLEYCAGKRQTFDLPLALVGTDWQKMIWRTLTEIPFGETRAYGEIAAQVGRPLAARAVGRANATNPIPLVIPCHRLIGANGALTGFGGGLHIKKRLLAHEARVRANGR
ncbi:MAG TPA: methylated-DNA--[protein]-cysteine S-methyltransferase [Ktedonobacterales bacterium]|nr:methylated-DNA--[protein]-cysteine S-methyltransferase [Ktedonobacterales bacterium]